MAKILLVEDDQQIRTTYAFVLNKKGHQVTEATNGDEAFTALTRGKYDIILLDMLMPESSGLDFLRKANLPIMSPQTKVVAISNTESPKIREEAEALGVIKYILKVEYDPYKIAGIVDEIANQ